MVCERPVLGTARVEWDSQGKNVCWVCVSKARGEVEAADRDLGSEDTKLKLCECPRKARKMGGEPGERVRRSLGTGGTDHGCERPPFVAMERIGIPMCCATHVRDPHWPCSGLCGLC